MTGIRSVLFLTSWRPSQGIIKRPRNGFGGRRERLVSFRFRWFRWAIEGVKEGLRPSVIDPGIAAPSAAPKPGAPLQLRCGWTSSYVVRGPKHRSVGFQR